MSTVLQQTESEFEVIPTGDYLFQITDFEEETGQYGPQIKFTLEIVKPAAYKGKTRFYWCSKKLSSGGKRNSKLFDMVEVAYNRPLAKGEPVDLDALIGRQLIGSILVESKDDSEFSKVVSVKAHKQAEPFPEVAPAKPAKKSAAPAEADPDDPFGDE